VRERLARLGLRSRLMAVGLVGVAAALVLGGLLLYAAVAVSLDRATVGEAKSSADDVARLVEQHRLPDPVPVSGALVVQVLDGQNRVLAASATADRLTSIVTRAEAARLAAGGSFVVPGNRTGLSGELRLAAQEAGPAGDRVLVVAGVPTADLQTSQRALRTLMLVFFPLFLLLLAVIAWWVIGRTLRPVEELRRGAARIGESGDPTERLPVLPTRDEISALATTLNDMLARLASSSAKQRAFVADAAHELRSPLATMRTQLEVAQRVGDGGDLPADLLPEVGRLAALVEDLLVLARSANEAGAPDRAPVELAEVVRAVAARYAAARVPVVVAPPSGAAAEGSVVEVDRGDLERALGNLVDNAVRHARSRVTLGWQGTGELRAWVVDDGNGVPAHERERVFDRFARLDEARDRDSGGSGLGLSITRELLRRNGARVWLEEASPGLRAVLAFSRPQR
jgi:signal transduction histidine kinase